MARIEKKLWPEYYEAFEAGTRHADLRLNDFDIAEGDTLVLREWDPSISDYTGRSLERIVTHVHRFNHADLERFHRIETILDKGLQVISLE